MPLQPHLAENVLEAPETSIGRVTMLLRLTLDSALRKGYGRTWEAWRDRVAPSRGVQVEAGMP